MLPIVNNRTVIGYANTKTQALRVIKKAYQQTDKRMNLEVWRRSPTMREILDLPDAWVFSWSYKY